MFCVRFLAFIGQTPEVVITSIQISWILETVLGGLHLFLI